MQTTMLADEMVVRFGNEVSSAFGGGSGVAAAFEGRLRCLCTAIGEKTVEI